MLYDKEIMTKNFIDNSMEKGKIYGQTVKVYFQQKPENKLEDKYKIPDGTIIEENHGKYILENREWVGYFGKVKRKDKIKNVLKGDLYYQYSRDRIDEKYNNKVFWRGYKKLFELYVMHDSIKFGYELIDEGWTTEDYLFILAIGGLNLSRLNEDDFKDKETYNYLKKYEKDKCLSKEKVLEIVDSHYNIQQTYKKINELNGESEEDIENKMFDEFNKYQDKAQYLTEKYLKKEYKRVEIDKVQGTLN